MKCPRCQSLDNKVIDSRLTIKNSAIRRRRECDNCKYRFSTLERIRVADLIVIKKDQNREPYDRNKIEEGIWKACQKRPITKQQIDTILNELEEKWNKDEEIATTKIGIDIMNKLKDLDEVAYIRFASVYRSFKDVNSFLQEAKKLSAN